MSGGCSVHGVPRLRERGRTERRLDHGNVDGTARRCRDVDSRHGSCVPGPPWDGTRGDGTMLSTTYDPGILKAFELGIIDP